jgi:hypothetical protein
MKPLVVDTNVAVVANDASLPADTPITRPLDCVAACIKALIELTEAGHLVLDTAGLIFDEYKTYLNFSGQPGVGDVFMKWVHDRQWNPEFCTRVEITPDSSKGFVEFPDDPELAAFDWSDRKFVAVARAHGKDVRILQAVDEDAWVQAEGVLRENGAPVQFLCRGMLD